MWGIAAKLSRLGVLGLNLRNAEYIAPYNPRKLYPLVDDKLKTKDLARAAGIPVPELYYVVRIQRQISELPQVLARYSDFVVKPAGGSGGEGIVVISGRTKNLYRAISGEILSEEELGHHVSNILNGMFSLGGKQDKAMIEYRVKFDPVFQNICYLGVPDIRIIVFLGVPVMAMVRLPTRMSGGKANLHQGAIGAGIDMRTGQTLSAVWQNDVIYEHPDTGHVVSGVSIPRWPELLQLAARTYELTGLGYQGVDIVLDVEHGPYILELNARPGLNIQIANRAGLEPRLQMVKANRERLREVSDRVNFALINFGVETKIGP